MRTYPASGCTRVVKENENKRSPEGGKHGNKTKDKSHDERRWDKVAQSLHSKEAWESISLHSLEDIVLGNIEYLGIVATILFDGSSDLCGNRTWEGDFSLSSRKKESVENFLS
jgi:hypothetical protein